MGVKIFYRNHRRNWLGDDLSVQVRSERGGDFVHLQSDGGLLKLDRSNARVLAGVLGDFVDGDSPGGGFRRIL